MSDELPTVEIEGVTLWPAMIHDGTGYDDEWDKMSESHLVALLAALPDEQRGRLLLPYVDELKPLASALAERLASFGAEKLAEQRDEARSKVAELERELASSDGRRREARQLLARAFRLSRRPAAIEQLLELMGKVGDYLKRTSDPNDILREASERGNHERRRDRD